MVNIFKDKNKKFFFCGIGGIFMSALAEYLFVNGYTVFGSDKKQNDNTSRLVKLGIKVFCSHAPENLSGADYFVYTSAVSSDNPELLQAKKVGIPIIKRSELLGEILTRYKKSVAVSGSHGKTTTTCMIAHVLERGGLSPTAFIGGKDMIYGNLKTGKDLIAVTEACEYKKNFLDLKPNITVVLNVDNDHVESYGDFCEEIKTFGEFAKNTVCIINADDTNFERVCPENYVTYAIKNPAKYKAKNISSFQGGCAFTAYYCNKRLFRVRLKVEGVHNIYNALAAIAVAGFLGVDNKAIARGLSDFYGVERRNEYLGKIDGVPCYADYAHHPTEINAYLNSLPDIKNTLVIFQPHTYSRTQNLMCDFVKVLSRCKNLIIHKTFPARESYKKSGSAKTLCANLIKRGVNARYTTTFNEIEKHIENFKNLERIAIIGAGDLYFTARNKAVKIEKNKL